MKKTIIISISIFLLLILGISIIINTDNSKNMFNINLCELYANQESIKISYPEKTVILNNESYSLEEIKKDCKRKIYK